MNNIIIATYIYKLYLKHTLRSYFKLGNFILLQLNNYFNGTFMSYSCMYYLVLVNLSNKTLIDGLILYRSFNKDICKFFGEFYFSLNLFIKSSAFAFYAFL